MYLHTINGFVEADAWDGTPVPDEAHNLALRRASSRGKVIVVRARDQRTLLEYAMLLPERRRPEIFASPPGWDYEWRMYVPEDSWVRILVAVARSLDYRNFKHTCQAETPEQYQLALGIWNAAHSKARR